MRDEKRTSSSTHVPSSRSPRGLVRHPRNVLFHPVVSSAPSFCLPRVVRKVCPPSIVFLPLLPLNSQLLVAKVQQDDREKSSYWERGERSRNGNAGDRSPARLPVFARIPRGPARVCITRTRVCARHTHSHTGVHLHATHYACTPSPLRSLALARVRTYAHKYAYGRVSESVVTRCSECIRGENAVALAAQPANRVIGRRIHPSRLPSRASSRRAVALRISALVFFAFLFLLLLFFFSFFGLSSCPSINSSAFASPPRLLFPRLSASSSGDAAALAAGDLKVAREEYFNRVKDFKITMGKFRIYFSYYK